MHWISKLIKKNPYVFLVILLGIFGLSIGLKSLHKYKNVDIRPEFVIQVSEIQNGRPVISYSNSLDLPGITVTSTNEGLSIIKQSADNKTLQTYLKLTYTEIDDTAYKLSIDSDINFRLVWQVKGNWKIFSYDKELKSDSFTPGKHEITMILDEGLFGPVTSAIFFEIILEKDGGVSTLTPEKYCGYEIITEGYPFETYRICGIGKNSEQETIDFIVLHWKKINPDKYSVDINSKVDFTFEWKTEEQNRVTCNGKELHGKLFKPGKYEIAISEKTTK